MVAPEHHAPASPALVAARARGAVYVKGELSLDSNPLIDEAAKRVGLTAPELVERKERGDFYAFEASPGVYRFPDWQFAVPQPGLRLLVQAFAGTSVWALHLFTARANMYLGNESPRDYLTRADFDIEALRRAVGYRLYENQGAA